MLFQIIFWFSVLAFFTGSMEMALMFMALFLIAGGAKMCGMCRNDLNKD